MSRTVDGDWGTYRCRIETRTTWRGKTRWRYVVERTFARVTDDERTGWWRRDKARAVADGERALDSYDMAAQRAKGEYL